MTKVVYQIGEIYTTLYSEALKLKEQFPHATCKCHYIPVDQQTQAQKDAQKEHARKAAEYRAAHKK